MPFPKALKEIQVRLGSHIDFALWFCIQATSKTKSKPRDLETYCTEIKKGGGVGNQSHLTFHTSHTFADIFNNPKEAASYNHTLHSKFLYPILQRLKEIELFLSFCMFIFICTPFSSDILYTTQPNFFHISRYGCRRLMGLTLRNCNEK